MRRRTAMTLGATAAVAVSVGAFSAQGGIRTSTEPEIEIEDFSFRPARKVVRPGVVVTWKNRDQARHNATSVKRVGGKRVFRTATKGFRGEMTARAPRQRGTYAYFCSVHPQIRGTLVVRR